MSLFFQNSVKLVGTKSTLKSTPACEWVLFPNHFKNVDYWYINIVIYLLFVMHGLLF